jgi:predicted nucleic acid-binding protein
LAQLGQSWVTTPPPETLVLDASAIVEALLGSELGIDVRVRMRGCELHAPAHFDAEVLSALGRLHRAGELDQTTVATALRELAQAPIRRHQLAGLVSGAWERRDRYRLVDALYVELTASLASAVLVTTDAPLARSFDRAELIAAAD